MERRGPIAIREAWPFAAIAGSSVAATGLLELGGRAEVFEPYLGPLDPLLVLIGAFAAGLGALIILRRYGFAVISNVSGVIFATSVAVPLAAIVIAVDLLAGIPVSNVPWPWALAFYPAIAFVVEVFFHLLPLAAILPLTAFAWRRVSGRALHTAIVAVSLIEPIFQLAVAAPQQSWLAIYVFGQIWAVNLAQLIAFRRNGFVSMIAVRLVYYAFWHVLWGALRLHH